MSQAMNSNEDYCSFTLPSDLSQGGLPGEADICKDLEDSDPAVKRAALKSAIMAMLGGEALPKVLMQVIRFCINTEDHQLKKLMMLYWEVVPKYQPQSAGSKEKPKLLPEMILVCNALMNDLNHPNEYVRGSMLRFLCKVKDSEILGPLMASVKQCLEHRHSYVRKNAALCIFHVYKLFGDNLLPDAPDLMERFILAETDICARRNAFLMLFNCSEEIAIEFLSQNVDDVMKFGEGFALLVLELTRKVCRRDPAQKSRFVRVLFQMLTSSSASVSYEAAWTLVSLSSAPTAIRAAASTYSSLLSSQNDNNVKMIVLERLEDLRKKHTKVLQEVLMDILRAISSPNPDICQKTLDISMPLVNSRNVEEVVSLLKREVLKTQDSDMDKGSSFRAMLIKAIHSCASKFPDVAEGVVSTLISFIGGDGALDVVIFVRAIVEQYGELRPNVLSTLMSSIADINKSDVMCVVLWILGEYCVEEETIKDAFEEIMTNLGDAPYLVVEKNEVKKDEEPTMVTKNVVLADGTYATQTVMSEPAKKTDDVSMTNLRSMVVEGDIFLCSILASTLTKFCLRKKSKARTIKSLLAMCGFAKMAEVKASSQKSAQSDLAERITLCSRMLLDSKTSEMLSAAWLDSGKQTFSSLLAELRDKAAAETKEEGSTTVTQCDDLIHIRQLKNSSGAGEIDLDDGSDLLRATGQGSEGDSGFSSGLKNTHQLTGFSDPVYCEASIIVNDYDIKLSLILINRTSDPVSVSVELSTIGDMKIVERPQSRTIGPLDQCVLSGSIKISSTETGHIFGTIVHENPMNPSAPKGYINLNDIHLDIMDFIKPATCSDELFRSMWAEFEWENKVAITTSIESLYDFLDHIVAKTNMSCLTPINRNSETHFLAANLYARSVFKEDALVNVSVEKKAEDGKLTGYIRIRSKTQGIALSLGDRITSVQRRIAEDDAAPQATGTTTQ
mmetsp:Transcript_10254/g.21075  ORF Transcript_10254/g.21075 Transcript_10254/m.21075 type:complete len:956 (-) Transcript_10254:55-2922(-)|eukprot:CAMPEP_0118644150 /NCGR_PEP_ID=MMETSP0785-20121206/6779_1 /TAXON_ID=91992 /ORGANISM="Bolidomonas pacifica, Strain CCMP 1866" /LENGTH=955 /DNA_ID=CAMNT_0006535877 /DNA_START=313 /DNA_END=3180 /DNA_ORIENTATION=+